MIQLQIAHYKFRFRVAVLLLAALLVTITGGLYISNLWEEAAVKAEYHIRNDCFFCPNTGDDPGYDDKPTPPTVLVYCKLEGTNTNIPITNVKVDYTLRRLAGICRHQNCRLNDGEKGDIRFYESAYHAFGDRTDSRGLSVLDVPINAYGSPHYSVPYDGNLNGLFEWKWWYYNAANGNDREWNVTNWRHTEPTFTASIDMSTLPASFNYGGQQIRVDRNPATIKHVTAPEQLLPQFYLSNYRDILVTSSPWNHHRDDDDNECRQNFNVLTTAQLKAQFPAEVQETLRCFQEGWRCDSTSNDVNTYRNVCTNRSSTEDKTTSAWAPGRPGCNYDPASKTFSCITNTVGTGTQARKVGFGYTFWTGKNDDGDWQLFTAPVGVTVRAPAGYNTNTVRAGFPIRTYVENHMRTYVYAPQGNGNGQYQGMWRAIAKEYGGFVKISDEDAGTIRPNSTLDAAGIPYYSANKPPIPIIDLAPGRNLQYYLDYPIIVPKFELACKPLDQGSTVPNYDGAVQIFDSEASACPAGATCNDPVQSGNKLIPSNTPIHVGTYDNANNSRRCTGELNDNGECVNGTWEYIGRDMNPFEITVDVMNLGDTDRNGADLPVPYRNLRETTVVFQTAGVNLPADPNNLKFLIQYNGTDVANANGVQCMQPSGYATTVANWQNCINNPACSGCAELKKQNGQNFVPLAASVGGPGTASRQRTLKFRYQVAFRDPQGNWQAGDKNIFILPRTADPTANAVNSNQGWNLINNAGRPCQWTTSWDCSPAGSAGTVPGVLAFDVTAPGGTLSSYEDQALGASEIWYQILMNDADTQGFFGRFARKCRNNTTPCQVGWMQNQYEYRGRDHFTNRGVVGQQWTSISGNTYKIVLVGAEGNDKIQSGIYLYDKASNSRWIRGNDVQVQASWFKTSLGDVYSYGDANSGFSLQLSSAYAAEDQEIESRFLNASFRPQRATLSGFFLGTNAANIGASGGHTGLQQGFNGNYNRAVFQATRYDDYNNTALFTLDPQRYANSGVFGWYESMYQILLDATTQNCATLGATSCAPSTINAGTSSTTLVNAIQSATTPYKFIVVNGGSFNIAAGTRCRGVNTIFLTNNAQVTIDNDLLAANNISGCLFVLNGNTPTKVTIGDSQIANGTSFGLATTGSFTDVVEAGFILERAAQFTVAQGTQGSDGRMDRLILRGFVFAATNAPVTFQRDLALRDNRNYPAEWLIYDTRSIDLYRTLAGDNRSITITCTAELQHPECR